MAVNSELCLQLGPLAESSARPQIQHCCWIAPGGASRSLNTSQRRNCFRALVLQKRRLKAHGAVSECQSRVTHLRGDAARFPRPRALECVLRALEDTKNGSVRAKSDPGLSSLRTSDIVAKKICDPPSRQGFTSDSTRRKRATTHRGHSPHLHGKRWSKVNSLSGHQEQLSKGKVRSRFVFTSHVRHRSEENM